MENCNVNTSGIEKYFSENQELADYFLEEYFFKDMRLGNENRFNKSIELIISPRCNLGCKYCYIHKHRKEIFSEDCFDEEKTISNLKLILKWLEKNNFNPDLDIFSGELFAQEIGYKALETIIEHERTISPELRPKLITIPTNFTFVQKPELVERVEKIRADFKELGIHMGLSASFDGKYMEQNRPFLYELDIETGCTDRNDDYYDKAFEYAHKTHSGFHPMVYSKGIEHWKKNFEWFQEKFEQYGIPWDAIYLLQVRNEEWTEQNIKDFTDFVKYLIDFAYEKLDKDPVALAKWIIGTSGFNIIGQSIMRCGRGYTCAIQTNIPIRVSDLAIYPCHRLGYKDFVYAHLVPDKEKILKMDCHNVELMVSIYAGARVGQPYCAECPINRICTGGCLGANYESNRNMLVPIPSVCLVAYALAITIMTHLKKLGAWNYIIPSIGDDLYQQFLYLEEQVENV